MASPFSVFRKHERWMMAVLGVMAMIAFVFFDPLFGMRSGPGGNDPVVAETTLYGDIHETELARMLGARALANRFAQQTIAMAYGFAPQGYFGSETERSVVDTMLLARKAEQMGMRMTDEEVTRFLQLLSDNRVTGDQFTEILNGITGRRGNRRQLYDALRTELLAQRLTANFAGSQQATPAERWESYQKLNSRAKIEAVPVAVADFVDKVGEPDNTAIQTLFDNYKELEPVPGSPSPGFKIPAKVAVQYLVADYEKFEDPSAVTYDEIVNEYEKSKDTRYLYSGDFDAATESPAADAEKKPADEQPAATEPAAEKPAEQQPAAPESKPEEGAAPAEKPAEAPAAEPAKPEGAAPTEAPSTPPQSRVSRGLDGIELALADAPALAEATALAQADAPPEKPVAEAAATPPAAEAAKPDAAAGEAEKSASGTVSLKDEYSLPQDVNPPKYDPLWKVESSIRTELARRKAAQKMQEVLNQVREQKLVKYGNDRTRWEVKHERDKTVQPPTPIDFDVLAKEFNLTTYTTKLLSAYELSQVEGIGESFVGERSFVQYAFGPLQLFQPVISGDAAGNQYLAWKIEQQEARVPKLDEIRDEVVRAWKMMEARKPALEHAKSLVQTAEKDKITLVELATRDVLEKVQPDPFSWLTYGTTPNINSRVPPRLSAVKGIEDPGAEFMQGVFRLPPGALGTAFNNPQTIVYVVQVQEYEPSPDVLRRSFLADDYRTYAQVTEPHFREQLTAWNNSIQAEAGLKWVRPPDARAGRNPNDFDDSESGD